MKALGPRNPDEMSLIQAHGESSILAQRADVNQNHENLLHVLCHVGRREK